MKNNKKIPACAATQNRERQNARNKMSLSKFITILIGKQEAFDRFTRIVGFCVRLYIVFACVWTICYLVGDILTKMGVG